MPHIELIIYLNSISIKTELKVCKYILLEIVAPGVATLLYLFYYGDQLCRVAKYIRKNEEKYICLYFWRTKLFFLLSL